MALQIAVDNIVDTEETREGIKIDKGAILTEDRID